MVGVNKTAAEWEINLAGLFAELIDKIWAIFASGVIFGTVIFLGAMLLIDTTYTATVSLYANNIASQSEIKDAVSYQDITASIMIANTCSAIIESDIVLNETIDRTECSYNKEILLKKLKVDPITNTEIIQIDFTDKSPKKAAFIVNTIAEVASEQIVDIVEGSSVKILNTAEIPTKPTGPGYLKIAVFAILLGCMLAVFVILLNSIFDLRVKSEADLEQWSYPVIGVVPDIASVKKRGGYYRAGSGKK